MTEKRLKNTSSNVICLGVVSFLNDISSEMIVPILPLFIKSLGAAAIVVGLLGAAQQGITSILQVLCGYLSDRTGKRKPFVSAGYLLSAVLKLLLAFSKTLPTAVIFASLERAGKGLRTPARDALIADSMQTQTGRGFGIHRAFDTAGAILGSVGTLVLFRVLGLDFNAIVLVAGILAFAALVPLCFVKEVTTSPGRALLQLGLANLPGPLRLFIAVSGLFGLANFSYMFLILMAQRFFSGTSSIAAPIALYILFNVFHFLFAVPLGIASDKFGRHRVLAFGYLLFSITLLGFALVRSVPALVILFALYGITLATVDGNQRALVADLARSQFKGTALGTYHMVTGLAALPAGLIAGLLWQNVAPQATFVFGSLTAAGATFLLIALTKYFHLSAGDLPM